MNEKDKPLWFRIIVDAVPVVTVIAALFGIWFAKQTLAKQDEQFRARNSPLIAFEPKPNIAHVPSAARNGNAPYVFAFETRNSSEVPAKNVGVTLRTYLID